MSNRTARQNIHDTLAFERDEALRPAVVIDLNELARLAEHDKPEAARQLAALTPAQRHMQAQAYASRMSAQYPDDAVTGAEMLALFERFIARYAPEPSAPSQDAAEHNQPYPTCEPESETPVTLAPDAVIAFSEMDGPACSEAPPQIRTFDLDLVRAQPLRLALEMQHTGDSYTRALAKALRILAEERTPFLFDGRTLTIASQSSPGAMQTTDGDGCSCKGAVRAVCWHRAAFDLLFMTDALIDRAGLRRALHAA